MLYTQVTASFLVKYHLESRTMLQAQVNETKMATRGRHVIC